MMTLLYSKPFIISLLHWLFSPSLSSSLLLSSSFHSSMMFLGHTRHTLATRPLHMSLLRALSPLLSLSFEICIQIPPTQGFPRWYRGKESAYQRRRCRRLRFNLWVGKIPRRRKWQATPVFLPGECHGQRSLVGFSPCGHKSWR